MIIQRLRDGTYRADFGTDGTQWAEWDPRQARQRITYSAGALSVFKRDLAELGLGRACSSCGYLEFEHNIDGAKRRRPADVSPLLGHRRKRRPNR